jgi:hypothetical protein
MVDISDGADTIHRKNRYWKAHTDTITNIDYRDSNPGIPNPGIPDLFSIPKSRDFGIEKFFNKYLFVA